MILKFLLTNKVVNAMIFMTIIIVKMTNKIFKGGKRMPLQNRVKELREMCIRDR